MHGPRNRLIPMADRLGKLAPLGPGDREALLSLPHSVKSVPAGAYLVRDGDPAEHCGLLLGGFAFRHKITGEGARQILSLHLAGEIVDLQNAFLRLADHNVQTLTECEVAFVPRNAVRDLAMANAAIGRAMWMQTLIDASIFREWVVNVGRRDSRARVAHLLCECSLRLEAAGLASNRRFELPMTQEQLADAVGLTSVHVNRVLRYLGEDGLISRDRRWVTIEDWDRLKQAGDFNERYLHHDLPGRGPSDEGP